MNDLNRNILMDVLFLYPLIIIGGFISPESWVGTLAFFLNVFAVILALYLLTDYDELYPELVVNYHKRDGDHWVYLIASSVVELFIFAYLSWYGFAVLWILYLILAFQYLRGPDE